MVLKMVLAGKGTRTLLLDKIAMMTTPSPRQAGHVVVGSLVGQDSNAMLILIKTINLGSLEVNWLPPIQKKNIFFNTMH